MKPCETNPTSIARRVSAKRRWIVGILVAAILVTMVVIFLLSSEGMTESGNRSRDVTMQIARLLYPGFDDMSYGHQMRIVNRMHLTVRKCAHFSEYALLGGLVVTALYVRFASYRRSMRFRLILMLSAAAFGLAYAISDEVHQKFVQRGASPWDVCIDLAGVLFGIAVATGWERIRKRRRLNNPHDEGEPDL